MSIRLRFTITLTLLGVLLFGGYALVSYRGEIDDLHIATEREILALGRSLATSVGNALRDRQRADVDQTLRALEPLEPRIRIHVHDLAGREIAHTQGATVDARLEADVERAASTGREYVDFEDKRAVFTAPLVGEDGKPLGAIAVARSLEDLDADLERTRLRLIVVVLAFVFGTLAAGVLLGTIYVSRPLATVLDGIAHVRDGDFKSRIAVPRHDEIGALVDEFNTMVAALAEARTRVEQETEARLRLERGLQGVDKMVTIGQLSAGLAHEIGSPLQVLSGRAAALERSSDPEAQRQAHILVEQCERITKIVEQLLSFGRRKPAVIAPCDVDQPVRGVLELLAGEARRRGVDHGFEGDAASHRIDADADQLQQVVLNLVKNALAATPKGGKITVRVEVVGERVRLIVRDTGTGIAADLVPRLFEPFFTTRAAEGGTGLGLAVVRAIAVEHHATVAVTSEPGRGAEFVVSFPAGHG